VKCKCCNIDIDIKGQSCYLRQGVTSVETNHSARSHFVEESFEFEVVDVGYCLFTLSYFPVLHAV